MRSWTVFAAAFTAALLACGGGEPVVCSASNEGAACATGATCQASLCARTVTGTVTQRRWLEGGPTAAVPVDLSTRSVRAVARTAGGWVERAGTAHADGTFEVRGVPVGRYWLATDFDGFPLWEERTESTVVLLADELGRATTPAAAAPTLLLSGLEPFDPELGVLRVFAVNAWSGATTSAVAAGATSASIALDPVRGLSSAEGDRVFVWQFAPRPVPGFLVSAAVAGAELPGGFEALPSVDVPLAPLPAVERTFDWRLAAFVQAATPSFETARHELLVTALPHQDRDLFLDAFARAFPLALGNQLVTIAYGRPGPPSWREGFVHRTTARRILRDSERTVNTFVSIESRGLVAANGVTRVVPVIGPPRDLVVLPTPGADIGRAGLTPTVRWSPPSVGRAERYVVRVDPGPGGLVALVPLGTGTSVEIPPGVLLPFFSFAVRVTAVADGGLASDVVGLFPP